jgi:valyl-tRNA synthetase
MQIVKSGDTSLGGDIDAINLVPKPIAGSTASKRARRSSPTSMRTALAVMTTDEDGNAVPLVENKKIMQPFGDRSHVVIEPMLTDQWFADAKTLAKPGHRLGARGRTQFVPKTGRTPTSTGWRTSSPGASRASSGGDTRSRPGTGRTATVFVEKSQEEAAEAARALRRGRRTHRDEDVLDTWFSSALWPFSTLGWPEQTEALRPGIRPACSSPASTSSSSGSPG